MQMCSTCMHSIRSLSPDISTIFPVQPCHEQSKYFCCEGNCLNVRFQINASFSAYADYSAYLIIFLTNEANIDWLQSHSDSGAVSLADNPGWADKLKNSRIFYDNHTKVSSILEYTTLQKVE